mmetsp:Transcript_9141/g.19356  ORF Transcript_9141/g.19356 Transcript_9141/m.19356 type:complete len:204 (-) Transcript_9141:681-1292(-)|eukprot:CAMPEP_0185847366 /NCGR_PEP_ID=MMETSP1354-20130828/2655_1 /TAXON_ID=708628 /ORGANISM="Erythrolobus madagascarensis, Strain CCMP3276" /LENGTH=203 /DNA_ID=CAMNT_0028547645 /DNA_START=93 /DNA_END=704 /DNA_ORIENTATION=-
MSFFRAKSKKGEKLDSTPSKGGGLLRGLSRKKVDGEGGGKSGEGGLLRSLTRGKSNRNADGSTGKQMNPDRVEKTKEEWKGCLTRGEYNVLRRHMMEKPYGGKYVKYSPPKGTEALFFCKGCDAPVFSGRQIIEPENGWLSFTTALPGATDKSFADVGGMSRMEVVCKGCDGFLGLVNRNLDINSAAVELREIGKQEYDILLG